MAAKRVPVPKVEKPKAPPLSESASSEEIADETPAIMTTAHTAYPERNTTMATNNALKKTIRLISDNREVIKRKAIVFVGTGIGMIIASAVNDAFNSPKPELIIVETPEVVTEKRATPRARKTAVPAQETTVAE